MGLIGGVSVPQTPHDYREVSASSARQRSAAFTGMEHANDIQIHQQPRFLASSASLAGPGTGPGRYGGPAACARKRLALATPSLVFLCAAAQCAAGRELTTVRALALTEAVPGAPATIPAAARRWQHVPRGPGELAKAGRGGHSGLAGSFNNSRLCNVFSDSLWAASARFGRPPVMMYPRPLLGFVEGRRARGAAAGAHSMKDNGVSCSARTSARRSQLGWWSLQPDLRFPGLVRRTIP